MASRRPVATGYVDPGCTGSTELRIHGVGGTTPEALLDHPHPVQVAGDATSGFYRRWDIDAISAGESAGCHVEGFNWGGMTSGSSRRALWLLLIPFLLVNVAHWALPGRAARRRGANTGAQRVLRLLALSLTMTLALAASETGIDLLGRQCGGSSCFKSAPSWLSSLAGHHAVLVGLGALVPLATLLLVGMLGRSTWKLNEKVTPQAVKSARASGDDPALADPLFWAGAEPVRRLRALHLAAGLAVAAIIQVLPVLDGPRRSLAIGVLLLAGLVVATSAIGVLSDGVARPHHRPPTDADKTRLAPLLMWAAAAIFGLAIVVDLLPRAVSTAPTVAHDMRRLDGLVQALAGSQTAMIILIAGLVLAAGLMPEASQADRRRPMDMLIAPALAVLAWLVAWFFTAGLTVRVANQLFSQPQHAVPASYSIAGALIAPGAVLILIGVGAFAFRWYRAATARQRQLVKSAPPPVGPAPGDPSPDARAGAIGSVRARAGLLDIVPQLVVAMTAASVLLGVVAVILDGAWSRLPDRHWVQQLADFGTLLLSLFIVRMLAVARQAWKQGSTRKSIGILWDLGTFWPRAVHPLAPPCYCERALPQLQTRLAQCAVNVDDRIVLAGHSQGSVIATALVLMPRPEQVRARIGLLTYGCPLGRLYVRAFPGYLGPQVLGVAARSGGGEHPAAPGVTVRTQAWRWLNLYRPTDPIGGAVDPAAATGTGPRPFGPSGAQRISEIDILLVDPDFSVPSGDIFPPTAAGHSHYREDATYDAAVADLLST